MYLLTNAIIFVYAYGVVMKQGTANAWNKINELSGKDKHLKKWFESPYVQSASQDRELIKVLDNNCL